MNLQAACGAGAEGFEPSTKVLETHVLPLHHAPMATTEVIIQIEETIVKLLFQKRENREI